MFAGIRWRLVGWTAGTLVLILVALGLVIQVALSRILIEQVDRDLAGRAQQSAAALELLARGERDDREGYSGGIFYLVVGPDGRLLANPQQVNVAGLQLPLTRGRSAGFATVSLNGQSTRLYARPLGDRLPSGSTLVVGQSLAAEDNALRLLLLVLVAGGGLGLLLSFGAAWFLAARALVPIERAFRRQQEFVADASHELRTPLTVLRASADLLSRHRSEPLEANGELFDDLRSELGRLERLASDLLTLARSDRGELELAVAPVDLGALAAELVRRAGPLATERGVVLTLQVEGQVPTAEVDPDRLQQVLLILLDNALKHSPPGGQARVELSEQGASAVIAVVDSGPGIAPEHLGRVFDRFYRADAARARDEGGTGLGLAIARTLIEAHGGELTLASAPGEGLRATVRLPLARPEPGRSALDTLRARLTRGAPRREPT